MTQQRVFCSHVWLYACVCVCVCVVRFAHTHNWPSSTCVCKGGGGYSRAGQPITPEFNYGIDYSFNRPPLWVTKASKKGRWSVPFQNINNIYNCSKECKTHEQTSEHTQNCKNENISRLIRKSMTSDISTCCSL